MKHCWRCGLTLPLDRFYNNRSRKDGKADDCKTCKLAANKVYLKNWKARDPEAWEAYRKTKLLGGKHSQAIRQNHLYNQLLSEQDGKCAACKRPASCQKIRFAFDHSHKTGKVRGLLCINCNVALGHIRDDVTLLYQMIEYLERHSQKPA